MRVEDNVCSNFGFRIVDLAVPRASEWERQYSWTLVPALTYAPHAENDVVLVNRCGREVVKVYVTDVDHVRPVRFYGLAVYDFVALHG